MPYLRNRLELLEEERSEYNFIVGKLYFEQSVKEKKGGLKGALCRFLEIVEKYSNYSKMDQVLFSLGEIYLIEEKPKEAEEYFQKVVDEFPNSKIATQARKKVEEINRKNFNF